MLIFRQKLFFGNDGYGGVKGRIKPAAKRSDSYRKFGPWEVRLCEFAADEYKNLDEEDVKTVDNIIKRISVNPFWGKYGQHPLWDYYDSMNEFVIWSAEINNEDRMTYFISKLQNIILITNLVGHFIVDRPYANRPNIWDDSKKKKR